MLDNVFQRVPRLQQGYHPEDVDAFLERARGAFDSRHKGGETMSPEQIRATVFRVKRGGYRTAQVDAVLDRIEDAFAAHEREQALNRGTEKDLMQSISEKAKRALPRLERPAGERFKRAAVFHIAYEVSAVDEFCDRLYSYFTSGAPMSVDEVRRVAFPRVHGRKGYDEATVDVFLEFVVEVMVRVR
ncbi:DivIVA domain-containing protein [Micrococcales bacterium 31B]|nr:DivIVA domain-containing protein [Micrococcales bacterium 31B]